MSALFELRPMNKHMVIEAIKADEKVGEGILFAPGNALEKQYRLGRITALAECDESKGLSVGMTVLYDSIGAVDHRVGKQGFTTVKVLNVVGIVQPKSDLDQLKDLAKTQVRNAMPSLEAAVVKDHG
jgi:co-chaperonin GroES (HSP10)